MYLLLYTSGFCLRWDNIWQLIKHANGWKHVYYINVYYTALFNSRSRPMNAFSHVYMWWKQSTETLIRMKWDWQTDTMYIHAPVTMLVTFSLKKQVYQCTTIMQWCMPPFLKQINLKSSSDKWVKTRSYVLVSFLLINSRSSFFTKSYQCKNRTTWTAVRAPFFL